MKLLVEKKEPATDLAQRPDVILIHGTGSSAHMWGAQIPPLVERGHRCLLINLRGHGGSDEPGEPTDLEVHIQDVLDTLDDLEVTKPAIFLGHSLGSIISLTIANRHKEMVERLLLAAFPSRVLPGMATAFKLFLAGPFKAMRGSKLHQRLAWRERTLLDTDAYTLRQIVDNFHALDYISQPLPVSCPVHFAAGRWDPVAPCFYVQHLHRLVPGSTLKIFEMAGHNFMDYNASSFNEWILSSLEN